jgi:hypothetical protein
MDVLLLVDAIYVFMGNDLKEKLSKSAQASVFSAVVLPKICFANGRYVTRDRS